MPRGRSRAGALRRGLKKVTGIVGSGSLLATAVVVGGLGAGAAQAVPLSDNADSIYGIRGPADTSLNGGVFRINTGTMSVVAPAEVTGQLNGSRSSNALGISADGVYVYTVDNGTNGSSTPSGAVQLRQYNTETGVTKRYNVPAAFGTTTLRGAVSPVTGIFYFSGSQTVYAFNPATEQIFAAGSLPQGTTNSNGDFAFGRNGNLYTFVAANLYETSASSLPTSASSSNLPMNLIATVSAFTALSSQGANGVAFGGNGYVYGTTTSGGTTYLIEYDIASGSVIDQEIISSDGNNFVDLASRHFLNTLTLRLDLPDGRYADSDQFTLDIDGAGDLIGAAATTTGTASGRQGAYAGPVIAAQGGGYGVSAAAAGGTDLSNYTTSIACTDGAGNAVATTGSPSSWSIVFPTVTSGTDVDCIITATPIPDVPDAPPTTDDGSTTGPQGAPQSWTPTPVAGDSPVDGSTLTLLDGDGDPVDEIVVPGVGRYEIVDDEIVFTPVPAFVGEAPTVDYRISDEAGQHATGTYTPTVTAVTPVASDDASTGGVNTPQSVDPLANDAPGDAAVPLVPSTLKLVDPDSGDPVETVTVPEGVYAIDRTDPAKPVIVFTPNANYFGTPTPVDYTVEDANGTPADATYQPEVTAEAPTTDSGETTGVQGQQQSWTPTPVPGFDFPIDWSTLTLVDAEGDPVAEIVVDGVGTYTVGGREIVFTPVPAFVGPAPTVDYRISDEAGQHAAGTYTPAVTAVTPVAADDSSVGRPNQPQSVDPLHNDAPGNLVVALVPKTLKLVDPASGDPVEAVTVPEGVYTIDRTDPDAPLIVFTPNENYFGTPTPVDYTVEDANGTIAGAEYQPQVVTDPPAVNDGATTGPQGLPQSWTPEPVAGDDFPVDWSTLTLLDAEGDPVAEIVVDGVGTYTVAGREIVFTPVPAFIGDAPTVDFRISDEGGQHAFGQYTPSTFAVAPVADDDASTGWWNTPQSVNPLRNDAPGDPGVPFDPATLTLLDGEGTPADTVTVREGVYTIDRTDPDAPLIVFTPNRGFTGIPTPVDYRVLDANGTPAEAAYQPVVRGPEGTESLAQTLVCGTDMVFDLGIQVTNLDRGSVTLVDAAGVPVTVLVVDGEGTWRLDVETGVVTFTPEGCFLGELTPVSWEGWLLDGTPVSGELSGSYVKKMPATGGDVGPVIGFAALGALLLSAGGALLIRRRRAIA